MTVADDVVLERIAPVIAVRDLAAALDRYRRLGFATELDEPAHYRLHAEWTSAGVEGRFMGPHDTPYGLREFVYVDPDGIVHRVGSPLAGG